jgi:phytoene desaturase
MTRRTAIVIGSGIGGIACAIRLQSLGFDTRIVEQLDDVGGRAYVRRAEGFTFDMGPTVLTVPHFIEELFSLERDVAMLSAPDFPTDPEMVSVTMRFASTANPAASISRNWLSVVWSPVLTRQYAKTRLIVVTLYRIGVTKVGGVSKRV